MKTGRDWTEKNRNHVGTCTVCFNRFRGDKERVCAGVCRSCSAPRGTVPPGEYTNPANRDSGGC